MDMRERQKTLDKIQELARFVAEYEAKNGMPPTVREMRDAIGTKSDSGIRNYITKAINAGLLRRLPGSVGPEGKKRAINRTVTAVWRPERRVEAIKAHIDALQRELTEQYGLAG